MQAMNGSAGSFRSRGRLIGCAMALVLALSALFASTAGAAPVSKTYFALGDSLAFGYSQQLFNENFPAEPPSAFENGYANVYLKKLKYKAEGLQLVNNGCPGETTDSMIGNGALAAALGIPGESPCDYHKKGFPLHHEYGGVSQLENALGTIAAESGAGTPVTVLTLNIGANDELHAIAKCEAEVKEEFEKEGKSKYGATPTAAVKGCLEAHAKELFEHILKNVGGILFVLREGSKFGGINYAGKIVVQGGYDPYGNVFGEGELLPGSNALASILNAEEVKVAEKFGACYANPQPYFNPGNKKEPERLQSLTNMANFTEFEGKKNGPDIHPTPAGYAKLAALMKKLCP